MLKKYCTACAFLSCAFSLSSKTPTPTPSDQIPSTAIAYTKQPSLVAILKETPKRTINITNNIKPEMLIKKHWTGQKTPDKFAILIDGKPVEPGETVTATVEDNTLSCNFNYSFMNGYRMGENQVTFNVPEKQDTLEMTFSWENEFRIILDKATAKEKIAIGS